MSDPLQFDQVGEKHTCTAVSFAAQQRTVSKHEFIACT